jgi:hypothetical protein
MTGNTRRAGDTRPYKRGSDGHLGWLPDGDEPFRWLPRHGEPTCILEWITQKAIKITAWLPVYTSIMVTLTLAVLLKGC